jgi:S1-C subfamily serine protease
VVQWTDERLRRVNLNWVDALVLVLALLAAASGWRQGVATAVLAFTGVLVGAVVGVRLAPVLIESVQSTAARAALGVGVVVLLVAVGQTAGVLLGRAVRASLTQKAVRTVDSALGSVVQATAVLVAAWLLAVPLTSSASTSLASAVRGSAVLAGVNDVLPVQAQKLPAEFGALLNTSQLPSVLGPFGRTPITQVDAPDTTLQGTAVVQTLRKSVLKVRGVAPSCSRGLEGTGFVVAPERVMTNAHVVAGTDQVGVESGGALLTATVVLYDPETDIAVLDVPGLQAPVLGFAPAAASTGTSAIVLGYPLDGAYTASAARVREDITLRGPDIYDSSTVSRNVYTVRGTVRSGNSGGPLVNTSGAVLGVVFGAAVDDPETGFVLTAEEVSGEVSAASTARGAVGTGACTS